MRLTQRLIFLFLAVFFLAFCGKKITAQTIEFKTLPGYCYAGTSYFFSPTNFVIGCEGGILRSTNNGVKVDTAFSCVYGVGSLTFEKQLGFALQRNAWGTNPTLIKSIDSGKNWQGSDTLPYDFYQVCYKNGQLIGLANGVSLYRSFDMGNSWQALHNFQPESSVILGHGREVMTIPTIEWNEQGFYYTVNSSLWMSKDLHNWTLLHPPILAISGQSSSLNGKIKMVSGRIIVGNDDAPAYAYTTNDGQSWQSSTFPQSNGDANVALWTSKGVFVGVNTGSMIIPISQFYLVKNNVWNQLIDTMMAFVAIDCKDDVLLATGYLSDELPSTVIISANLNITGIGSNPPAAIQNFELQQNYPNPFNPSTTIKYKLPKGSYVHLNIYDQNGRLVAELYNGYQNSGFHSAIFNGSELASGTYYYVLNAGEMSETKKMLLIK